MSDLSTPPTSSPAPHADGGPYDAGTIDVKKKRSLTTLVIALLVIIAVLMSVIGILISQKEPSQPAAEQSNSTSQQMMVPSDSDATASGETEAPKEPAPTGEELNYAPSHTSEEGLKILRAEQKRDPNDGHALGKVDAPVVMVVYSDFACPYCTLFATKVKPELQPFVDNGSLRIEWRDLAQISETSPLAAQAGRAAAAQGKFWPFHDLVYAAAKPGDHPVYTIDNLIAFAQQAGITDIEKFKADTLSETTAQQVNEATGHAFSIGITGTPFAFIGDAVISGYQEPQFFVRTVEEQLKLAQANG